METTKRMPREIARLGDGDVFIKRTSTGAIKAIKGRLKLEERKGHLSVIQGKAMITAAGYNEMNKIAGISIITPEKLTLPDGSVVVNPFPIIDKDSGTIDKVWVKKTAIGFSPIGNLVMTSSTLLYDIRMYFIQDLNKKIQKSKNAGKMCIENTLSEDEKKRGMFLRIQGTMGLWADLNNVDILKCMDTYIQNKLFAERKAQTIAERNCLKKHPSLSQIYVDASGPEHNHYGYVDVIGYNHDLTREDLLKLAQMAERGEDISEYKGMKIDVIDANAIDDVTEDDVMAASDEEEISHNNELPESTGGKRITPININQKEKEKIPVSNNNNSSSEGQSRKDNMLADLNTAKEILGEEAFLKIIDDNFKKPLEQLTVGQLEMARALMNSQIDQGGEF